IAHPRGRRVVSERPGDVGHGDLLSTRRRQRGDHVDLHQRVLHQQPGGADGGAGRRRREELTPHLVEAEEILEVRVKHLGLHDVLERGAGRLQGLDEVFEDEARLALDVRAVERERRIHAGLAWHAGLEVAGQLAGGEDQVADHDSLGVGGQRAGAVGLDHTAGRLRHGGDQIDLDEGAGHQQTGRADRRAGRWGREELFPHLVEGVEVPEIGVEDLSLHHVIERRPGGLERLRQILEHVARLPLDGRAVVGERRVEARRGRDAVLEVTGQLTGGEDEIPGASRRRVEGQRLGNSRDRDVHAWHARENNPFSRPFPRTARHRRSALYIARYRDPYPRLYFPRLVTPLHSRNRCDRLSRLGPKPRQEGTGPMREMILTAPTDQVPPLRAIVEASITWGLSRCGGNVADAADLLQVSRDMVRDWEPNTQDEAVRIVDREELTSSPEPTLDVPAPLEGDAVAPTSLGYVLL